MNVKQSYFDFLHEQGAKEKVQAVIRKGIDEWKQKQAYEYKPGTDPYTGDYSGEVWQIPGKTIGDICKTDMEVLEAYSGRSEATHMSKCGLSYNRVADEITWDINNCMGELRGEWAMQNLDELLAWKGMERDHEWEEDDIYEVISEQILVDEYLNYEWMKETFPEYIEVSDAMPGRYEELIFDVDD